MREPGDMLLFALSAWEHTGWPAFKKAFNEIHRIHLSAGEICPSDLVQFERARALRNLVTLGHCEVDYSGGPSVSISPPILVGLPYPGLPRAVLCGSRLPTTTKLIHKLCNESKQSLRLIIDSQQKRSFYAPARVELEADSYWGLEKIAKEIGIEFSKTPASWLLTEAAGSVDQFMDQLNWSEQPEVNWERQDFNPLRLSFTPASQNSSGSVTAFRLSRYRNVISSQWEYRLINNNRSAPTHPEWGRYIVLRSCLHNALLYDTKSGSLAAARGAPLPALVARALVLCSGYVPQTVPARQIISKVNEQYGFDIYRGVPTDVVEVITHKLGQQGPLDALIIQEETS